LWLFRDAIVFAIVATNIQAAKDSSPALMMDAFEPSLIERARRKHM